MSTATRSGTVTLNAAFLQDIKDLNSDLHKRLDRLRRIFERPRMVACRTRALTQMLSQLRDDLALLFTIEESLGYFDEPVEVAPWLSEQASNLRAEHSTLYLEIVRILDDADALARNHEAILYAQRVPSRFLAFYDRFQAHERNENDLIIDALYIDIGVGD